MISTLKSLRALADPTRLRIVALLERDELSVNELQEITRMGQSRISTHLGLLSDCGLVSHAGMGSGPFTSLTRKADGTTGEFINSPFAGLRNYPNTAATR
jgi:ArsR family transcriptional regulator